MATIETSQDKSIGELFTDLVRQIGDLVHNEIALAKAEVGQKVANVGKSAGMLIGGGVFAFVGFLALTATFIIALGEAGVKWWLAALIVSAVELILGAVLVSMGLKTLKETDLTPHQTIQTLKEDEQWIKQQVH